MLSPHTYTPVHNLPIEPTTPYSYTVLQLLLNDPYAVHTSKVLFSKRKKTSIVSRTNVCASATGIHTENKTIKI